MAGTGPLSRLAIIPGALSAFGSLSIDMYLPTFQAILRDLAASPAQVQLTLAVFFGGLGLGHAFYSPIADRYSRLRPLCFGLALFVAASAATASAIMPAVNTSAARMIRAIR
jgi:DHA1 family bicyclomycin/chloramphenicol resistance-like MFS transporter